MFIVRYVKSICMCNFNKNLLFMMIYREFDTSVSNQRDTLWLDNFYIIQFISYLFIYHIVINCLGLSFESGISVLINIVATHYFSCFYRYKWINRVFSFQTLRFYLSKSPVTSCMSLGQTINFLNERTPILIIVFRYNSFM